MTGHLITDPNATVTRPAWAAKWRSLSAALADEVPVIADRDDLLVAIGPGAGHGSPACFLPHHATIEVDGTHLGKVDPATATPHRVGDRARYPTVWGLLVHECAHARHSIWETPAGAPAAWVKAALLLEESRIERAHIRRRPDDRQWLRASATNLILADTKADDPAHAPAMTPLDAAHTTGLLLARVDAGILTGTEVAPVARTVKKVLGADTFTALRTLWKAALRVADDDATAMIDLGRRWCEVLGINPHAPTSPQPLPSPGGAANSAAGGGRSALAEAITTSLAKVTAAVQREQTPPTPTNPGPATASNGTEEAAAKAAHTVFGVGGPPSGRTATRGTRPPTSGERVAARTLARALSTAGIRDRTTTKTTSPVPPGRLRMRGALAADAQRAAGAIPTAEPFTRTSRRIVPAPPLRLGIACDVSGSMDDYAAPVASTAWILAHAASHTPVPAETATVIFGHHVRPITHPGTAPTKVTEFAAKDNDHDLPTAIDALDGALNLSHPGAARLLVIVSDGRYWGTPRKGGQTRIDRLRATGCGVLWLAPNTSSTPLDGATVHQLTNPATTARTIGRAATTALRAAAR